MGRSLRGSMGTCSLLHSDDSVCRIRISLVQTRLGAPTVLTRLLCVLVCLSTQAVWGRVKGNRWRMRIRKKARLCSARRRSCAGRRATTGPCGSSAVCSASARSQPSARAVEKFGGSAFAGTGTVSSFSPYGPMGLMTASDRSVRATAGPRARLPHMGFAEQARPSNVLRHPRASRTRGSNVPDRSGEEGTQ